MRISEHRFEKYMYCARCVDFLVNIKRFFIPLVQCSLLKGAEEHPMTWLNIFSPHLQENE